MPHSRDRSVPPFRLQSGYQICYSLAFKVNSIGCIQQTGSPNVLSPLVGESQSEGEMPMKQLNAIRSGIDHGPYTRNGARPWVVGHRLR